MYELNGEEITLETLQGYASEFGMELEPYLDFMKEKGLVEKTDGVAVNDAAVAPQANTGLASENIFSELPEVSKEDVGLSEKQFVSKFNKTYDGLGFTAIEATYEDVQTIGAEKIGGVGFGFGDVSAFLRGKDSDYKSIRDYVTILSPPDENGVRQRKTVEVDEDFAGFATPGAKVSTKEISDFLGANIDKAEVDKEAYSFAWNIANSTPIEVDGKIKKLEDLSSEELTDHTDKLFSNIVSSGKIPGFDKVAKNINEDVEAFAADQLKTIQEKVSNGELTVEQAQAQYQANVDKEFDRLYDESPEWGKILTALEKGVGTRFKGDFSDKLRTEAENEKLPAWVVNNFSEDFVRQAYVTAKIKIPKAIDETQILFRANEIGNITEEIKELSELNPNDKYNASLFGPRLERAKRPGNRTVGGRLEYLGKRKAELTQKVVYDLIQQDGYQKKLKDIRVPSAFGKTIDDPDLTLDEWQGMLGDQAIQMLGALVSFGGSTFVQEGGGAAMEIIEIEAAKKLAGKMTAKDFFGEDPDDVEGVKKKFDMGEPDPSMQLNEDGSIGTDKLSSENIEAALKQFRALPLEDTKDENGNVIPGRLTRISNIIDSGEVSLNEAFAVGGITAGLDFASNVVAVKGAGKLIPKNVLENLAKGKLKRAFKGIGKDKAVKAVSVATTTEVATESLQEVTSMEGVKLSTGYRPNKERYLKRLFEAGTQALLVTGVYVGGGQVASTSLNEGLAQIKSLPQGKMRVAINARKKALEQQQAAGFITEDQMLDQFTELNAIENTLATTEAADKLTLEEKDKLIKQYQTLRTEKENLTEAEKKFEDSKNNIDEFDLSGVPGGNVVTNEEVAVDDAKSKVQEAQQEIYKIFFANSLKTNGLRLAELVNNNDGDVLGNTNMVVFESAEEARYNLEILGFSQNTNGTWKYKGKFMKSEDTRLINKILGGQVNAGFFNIDGLKETGIFINQALQNKIKEGVENSFNAIHHETFHAFTNKLTFDQLKEITTGLNTELQALSEKDPRIKVLIKALNKQLGKFDKSKRTYHDEYLGYLSDLFHILDINQEYLSKANSISFFGMSKYFQSAHQELFQTSEQIVKMSPSQLIEFMRGFNIGKSQMTLPTVKRSTDAKEQKQDVKQQSLLSEGLYQQLTREFEESVNDYKSVVGEETAKTLAANIAAITLQGEVFNRLPKNELEGFEREDLQEIVEDFTSDPKVLENKSREHAKIKNRGIVGLLKGYNVGFEGGVMGYLNSKKRGFRLLDLRLIEFVQAHPNYGSFRKSLSDEGVISAVDETTQSLSPEDILIQQEEQKQDSDRQKRDGTIMLHEQAEKTGLKLTPAFEKAIELLGELYRNNVLTETGIKDLKKNFPKQYQEVYSLVQEAFGVKPKPGILTQTDIQNSQQMMGRLGVDFFRSYVFMNQYTKGVGIVDGKGNFVVDKNTDYLATGVPSGLQTQRITQANNIKVSEDLFYETIMRMADKGPQKGKLIPKRPKNLVIKKLKKFDDKFFNETMGIVKGDINIKEKASNVSQKHVGIHHMMTLELMSQAARRDMPRGRNFDMLSDGLPSSLASEFIYKLDPELFKEFMGTYQAINDIMGVYASNYDKGGLKEVLRNKLSAAFSNPMITKLTNVLDPIYAQYSVELAKVEKGLITIEELSTLNQTLESELVQDVVLANTLDIRNDDGTKAQSMEEVWSNIGHVTKMRQSTSLFAEKLISDFGQQKGLELIVKYLLPSVVGSGKIADGRFDVIDGALVEVGIENVGRNRKKLFKNLEDFFNSNHGINKLLDDYLNVELKQTARLDKDGNVVQQINEIFVGDTKIEINTTLLAQSSLGMLNKIKKDGGELKVKEESKKQAEEAMQYVDDIIRFFNDASYLNDTHSAMMLNGLNSDMRSPMRRAARFMYVVDGVETYKNPGKTLEYEHMIPAQWQMMRHVAQVRDGSLTKENLSELYNQYTVAIIPKTMDLVVKNSGLNSTMQSGYEVGQHSSGRYYNNVTLGRDNMFAIRELNTQNKWGEYHQEMAGKFDYNWKSYKTATDAITTSLASEEVRGMSTFDFDETLIDKGENFIIAEKNGQKIKITSAAWPIQGPSLAAQGYSFDFNDFINVRGGVAGPLMTKFKNQIAKYGIDNVFILTARPMESAPAIKAWLETQGIVMPIENITGLGNSTGEAKATWMLEKFAEGYNDMYFVDDAMPNVEAVKNVLDQLDIKSKVRQAIPLASEDISNIFNDILETVTGIESKKRFSTTKARKRGAKKGRFRPFIPPSHEDFAGLIYNFLGKGQEGNKHKEFFENALIRPLNRAYRELNAAKQAIASDFKNLNKKFPDIKKKLKKKIAQGDFTYEDAVRVYLWDKYNHEIPGLAPTDKTNLLEAVTMDPKLQMYAETIGIISRQDDYIAPYDGWEAGSIKIDLNEAMGATGRKKYFSEYLKNAEAIFSEENMNKIEAAFGPNFREALTDQLYRIETGRNSPQGQSKNIGKLMNWLNGSVATAMFFNMRSAVLQQMSIVNFLNYADNNVFLAAKAFANQKQYWNDWATIFNSNFLKERRKGIGTDINGNDLARSLSESRNPMMKLLKVLLQSGFAPTQIADNVAIATGGSTFYRNRTNTYVKQGLDQEAAETRAFEDFIEIAEETQQSAREDKVSMQQTSWIGKTILNFQNVTSQYNRLGKKSFLDLKNRRISKGYTTQRQSDVANVSRMAYYFAVQNLAFYGLQSALFAAMFDEEDENLTEEERKRKQKVLDKKEERIINGSIDSVLRGTGIYGAIVSVLKNMAIKYADQRNVNYNHDESAVLMEALNISPVIGIKARKIVIAEKTMNYDKKLIQYMDTWDIDNPMWSSHLAYIEGTTNAPLHKIYNKVQNTRESLNAQNTMLNRVLMFFGYSKYNLGVDENIEMQLLEEEAKAAYNKRKKQEKKNSKSKPKSNTSIFLD